MNTRDIVIINLINSLESRGEGGYKTAGIGSFLKDVAKKTYSLKNVAKKTYSLKNVAKKTYSLGGSAFNNVIKDPFSDYMKARKKFMGEAKIPSLFSGTSVSDYISHPIQSTKILGENIATKWKRLRSYRNPIIIDTSIAPTKKLPIGEEVYKGISASEKALLKKNPLFKGLTNNELEMLMANKDVVDKINKTVGEENKKLLMKKELGRLKEVYGKNQKLYEEAKNLNIPEADFLRKDIKGKPISFVSDTNKTWERTMGEALEKARNETNKIQQKTMNAQNDILQTAGISAVESSYSKNINDFANRLSKLLGASDITAVMNNPNKRNALIGMLTAALANSKDKKTKRMAGALLTAVINGAP